MTIVIQTWLPTFGQEMIQLNENNAVRLLSFYSVGGLISVLLLAWLLKRIIKRSWLKQWYPLARPYYQLSWRF